MDFFSPLKDSQKYQATFTENKESYGLRRKTGYKSPILDVKKYKGLLNLGTAGILKLNTKSTNNEPDFYEDIIHECQRLDPDFEFSKDKANCYRLILELIRKTVDLILANEKKDLKEELYIVKNENINLKLKIEEIQNKLKYFIEKKDKIAAREEKLKTGESKLSIDHKLLQAERSQINSTKKYFIQLEAEVKILRDEIKNQERLSRTQSLMAKLLMKDGLIYSRAGEETLDKNTSVSTNSLKSSASSKIQSLTERKQSPSSEIPLKLNLFGLKLQSDQVTKKYLQDLKEDLEAKSREIDTKNAKLIADDQSFKQEKYHFQKQLILLKSEKLQLESDKKYIEEFQETVANLENDLLEREKAIRLKEISIEEQFALDESWKSIDCLDLDSSRSAELKIVFLDLQKQIDHYHREVSEKETYFHNWAAKLTSREKAIDNKMRELQKIEKDLKSSELELSILKNETIPRLETQSNHVNNLLKEMFNKKLELDKKYSRINEENFQLDKKRKELEAMHQSKMYDNSIQEINSKIQLIKDKEADIRSIKPELAANAQAFSYFSKRLEEE